MQSLPHKPVGVSTYNWEDGTYTYDTYDVSQMDAQQVWRTAVALVASRARQALPECNTRLDKSLEIVLNSGVELLDDGSARVTSQSNGTTVYHLVNGACTCPDYAKAPGQWCKHRLARALTVKAIGITRTLGQAERTVTLSPEDLVPDPDARSGPVLAAETTPVAHVPRIPTEFLYERHGTTAILFGGLLHMAHEQGLLSLSVDVVTVTADLAVMRATARFKDGGQWTDIGDASPQNVGARIAPHFIRMASTRALARCLRTALDIPYVCSVELADE